MDNDANKEKLEKNRAAVDLWINTISTKGVVEAMDSALLRSVLEGYGAKFEISERAQGSLKHFSNSRRRPGMDEVWGRDNVSDYRIWLRHWVEEYENVTGRPLPVLEGTDIKTSGGLKFFTDLTIFAAGLMTQADYKRLTERRAEKGKIWQMRDPKTLYLPTDYSSFPPGFPQEAWGKIKSLVK